MWVQQNRSKELHLCHGLRKDYLKIFRCSTIWNAYKNINIYKVAFNMLIHIIMYV